VRLSFGTNAGAKILILRTTRAHLSVYGSATMYRMDWTDDRLQDRFDSIDRRFDEVDRRFDEVDRRFDEVDRRFEQVDRRFDRVDRDFRDLRSEMNQRFDGVDRQFTEMNQRFESMNRTLMQIGGGIIATLVAAIIAAIATHL